MRAMCARQPSGDRLQERIDSRSGSSRLMSSTTSASRLLVSTLSHMPPIDPGFNDSSEPYAPQRERDIAARYRRRTALVSESLLRFRTSSGCRPSSSGAHSRSIARRCSQAILLALQIRPRSTASARSHHACASSKLLSVVAAFISAPPVATVRHVVPVPDPFARRHHALRPPAGLRRRVSARTAQPDRNRRAAPRARRRRFGSGEPTCGSWLP